MSFFARKAAACSSTVLPGIPANFKNIFSLLDTDV
jgi:hypothetical protein